MPITRRERRELDRGLCRLRSGKCLRLQPATPPSMCGLGRRCKQSGSLVFANPKLIAKRATLEKPQRRKDGQDSHGVSAPSSASVRIRKQPLAIGVDDVGESPSAEIDSAEHDPQPARTSGGTAIDGASHTRHAEDVGIPIDQKWGFVAAHERRFCYNHGKDEWLLEYPDRWMSPSDFKFSRAEVTLKKMLQGYQPSAFASNSHKRNSPAECNCSLWSEVDTPVQHDNSGNMYLIQWKWRWTPESDIDDLEGVSASYKAQNMKIKRRCSARVEKTNKARVANRRSMMVVVELEKWLVEE